MTSHYRTTKAGWEDKGERAKESASEGESASENKREKERAKERVGREGVEGVE